MPFDARDMKGLMREITSGKIPAFPNRFSAGMQKLFAKLLERDTKKRITAAEVLNLDFIQAEIQTVRGNE